MNNSAVVRVAYLAVFVICATLLGYAMYLQHAQGLEPCPMCVLQRYAFIVIGFAALAATLHDPGFIGRCVYSGLIVIFALAGIGVAARHSRLQHYPPVSQGCGADIGYLLEALPLSQAFPAIFRGTGECSEVQWRFLGLSIPEWSLVWYGIFVVVAVMIVVKTKRS